MPLSRHFRLFGALIAVTALLSGCESFGRGLGKALMDEEVQTNTLCDITGPSYLGLSQTLDAEAAGKPRTLRLLVIHGIGPQEPGYSEFLVRGLADRLGLSLFDPEVKSITLASDRFPDAELGTLRITRYFDAKGRTLLIFEVTWSKVTEEQRALVAFDDFGAAAIQRAGINKALKSFVNKRLIDPLAYMGPSGDRIQESVAQSMCWMMQDADGYPLTGREVCRWQNASRVVAGTDSFALSGHSLGSRIALDTLTALGQAGAAPETVVLRQAFRNKSVGLFMLSNQLPLLQSGRVEPESVGEQARYCAPDAPDAADRWLRQLDIVAFSDPNDLLTYTIPIEFARQHIDSRLCARVVNVTVDVASKKSLAGFSTYASPEDAHVGYEADSRVLTLMTEGLGENAPPPQGCTWLRMTPAPPSGAKPRPQS
jgi:hypothetical protein